MYKKNFIWVSIVITFIFIISVIIETGFFDITSKEKLTVMLFLGSAIIVLGLFFFILYVVSSIVIEKFKKKNK